MSSDTDPLGIDPIEAAIVQMRTNAERYPIAKAFGNARKYTEL